MENRQHNNIADRLASSSFTDLRQYDEENNHKFDDDIDELDLTDSWGEHDSEINSLTGSLFSTALTV